MINNKEALYSVSEVAKSKVLGLGRYGIYYRIWNGEIRAFQKKGNDGRTYYKIPESAIQEYLNTFTSNKDKKPNS